MEFLKGIHYISFTSISMEDSLFFYIMVISNLAHYSTSPESYAEPYEKSLLCSFLLLFFVLHDKPLFETRSIDWISFCLIVIGFLTEPFHSRYYLRLFSFKPSPAGEKECATDCANFEFTLRKLIVRLFYVIICMCALVFLTNMHLTARHILLYVIGYSLLSTVVQYYSVFLATDSLESPVQSSNPECQMRIEASGEDEHESESNGDPDFQNNIL